jgi:uncharacterized protein YqiB (DUF1249 family)
MAMLADSLLLPQCVYRPGSFSGLMLLYESNYLKLMRLTGAIVPLEAHWISRVRNDNDLHLEWVLAEPYTHTLRLTYWLRDGCGSVTREPDLTVRIYRDAAQAEALHFRVPEERQKSRSQSRPPGGELNLRWQKNMMLNKWLEFLLDCGHGFG